MPVLFAYDVNRFSHDVVPFFSPIFFSYFIIKFDSSVKAMNDLQVAYRKDENVVRCGVVLNEEEPRRPCLDGQQCHFGELPIPEYDKMAYKRKVYGKMKYPASEAVPNKVKIRK